MKVIKYVDIEVDGIDTNDHPDYVDAYVESATAVMEDGSMREATEDELEALTEDGELMSSLITDWIC
jgi:hypothetical protein